MVDVTVGNSNCNHHGVRVWVMDPPSVGFSENYIFEFPLRLFGGPYFRFMHLHRREVLGIFGVLIMRMVAFFSQM